MELIDRAAVYEDMMYAMCGTGFQADMWNERKTKYCPHCGAIMNLEEKDNGT